MKTCSKCRHEMIQGATEISFSRNAIHIVVKNIPASICPNCDNKTLAADIAFYIDQVLLAIFDAEQPIRMREIVFEAA